MYEPADVRLPLGREGEIADLPPYYARVLSGKIRQNGSDNTGIAGAHWQEMIALTYGMITHVDEEVRRVLDALERTGRL